MRKLKWKKNVLFLSTCCGLWKWCFFLVYCMSNISIFHFLWYIRRILLFCIFLQTLNTWLRKWIKTSRIGNGRPLGSSGNFIKRRNIPFHERGIGMPYERQKSVLASESFLIGHVIESHRSTWCNYQTASWKTLNFFLWSDRTSSS